jgi:hypothetical protein
MSSFRKEDYISKIESYLAGGLSEHDLYVWNCGFLDEKNDNALLRITCATIHQLNETNPDYKSTKEEIEYLLQCLKENRTFNEAELNKANLIGLKRRFKNLSYN